MRLRSSCLRRTLDRELRRFFTLFSTSGTACGLQLHLTSIFGTVQMPKFSFNMLKQGCALSMLTRGAYSTNLQPDAHTFHA